MDRGPGDRAEEARMGREWEVRMDLVWEARMGPAWEDRMDRGWAEAPGVRLRRREEAAAGAA